MDDFRGTGWRFPIIPRAGALGYSGGDEGVGESLWLLLKTTVGERVMRPEFGSAISNLIFEPGSDQNLFAVEQAVRDAVIRWEPRVEILDVTVTIDDVSVVVALRYRVLRTNTDRSMTFPFYLAEGQVVEP
jgi:phage baseplate assembly protein W